MGNMNCYEKMMGMLTENMEKMSKAFEAAYDEEPEAIKRLDICKDYVQAVSGLGVIMSTVRLLRPIEPYGGFMGVSNTIDPQ